MKKLCFILFLFLGSNQHLFSQKFVNDFLNIGVGARAQGMAGSVTASGNDGTMAFWNPAGLTRLNSSLQVNAMHAEWFAGVANYDYASITKRFNEEKKAYGSLSVIRMGVDDIPNTLNLIGPDGSVNYDDITSFSAVSYGIFLSYGRQIINENISLGGSVKVINNSIGPFANSWGIGADLGILYSKKRFSLALMGRDITTTYNSWSFDFTEEDKAVLAATGNEIPISSTEVSKPQFSLGAAFHSDQSNANSIIHYVVEANLILSTEGLATGLGNENFNIDPALGLEVGYKNLVFLRLGAGNMQRILNEFGSSRRSTIIEPNAGLGIRLGKLQVDYALTNLGAIGDESGGLYSHIFSLTLNFDPKKK